MPDRRWHLCAPPGAGKTLIGLELARQVDAPTLVLAPTTAIRDQWRQSAAMFGVDPTLATSADPDAEVALRCATYQLLGNPGTAAEELASAGRRLWVAEVAAEVGGDEAATRRVAATERDDPARARREVARHVRTLRRSLGTGADVGVSRRSLLGERTSDLVERLAASGVGCLVLDECHHLLDWWALVVSALVERIEHDRALAVIGLTATLPDPESVREAANYGGLLGEVDAELHLAAMVAEGGVAPWRDGVRAVALTPDERRFVGQWSSELCTALDEHLLSEAFATWAVAQVELPAGGARLDAETLLASGQLPETDPGAWDRFWDRDPLATAALARWWTERGLSIPAGFEPPPGAVGPLALDDRLVLVDAWLHAPSLGAPADARAEISELGARFGLSFTTRGVRWGRSVADLVCARSAAKGPAAADVLAEEAMRRGPDLRALVVVDRDQATTPPAAARAVLGEDAGTTAVVMAALCARPEVAERGVVAVTSRGAWADALGAERIAAAIAVDPAMEGRWVSTEGSDVRGVVRLAGHGGTWSSARWLAAAESALDDGTAQVLLATRGLVGEGWDHPPINVLVDLSEVAGAGATTQLRGRALRLDPQRPDKLASLWDVVAVDPGATGDWRRLRRRHLRWWGPDAEGRVVTGAAKLHPLVEALAPPTGNALSRLNAESAAAVADVASTRQAWLALDPAGVATSAVAVRARRRRSVRSRTDRWPLLATTAAGSTAAGAAAGLAAALLPLPLLWPVALAGVAGGGLLGEQARRRDRGALATLEAFGDAVRAGLDAVGVPGLHGASVHVEAGPDGELVAVIVGADDVHAAQWADALEECLGPLARPRWLVRTGDRAWRVPSAVGATRDAAETFVAAVRRRLPDAELVRAGTPEATALVLADQAARSDEVHRTLRWR